MIWHFLAAVTVLTWQVPEIDMGDSFTPFIVQRSADGSTWNNLQPSVPAGGPYTFTDPTTPNPAWLYRISEQTVNHVTIPYNTVRVGGGPGTLAWITNATTIGVGRVQRGGLLENSGSLYAIVNFQGTVNMGDQQFNSEAGSPLIAKYNPASGALVYSRRLASNGSCSVYGLCINSSGKLIIAGFFNGGPVDFGNGHTLTENAGGGTAFGDAFIAVFTSPNGLCESAVRFTSGQSGSMESLLGICIDASDNYYVTGNIQKDTPFGGFTATGPGLVVAKFNSSNVCQFCTSLVSTTASTSDRAFAIDIDRISGGVYVTGSNRPGLQLSGGVTLANSGMFLAKYNSSTGAYIWDKHFDNGDGYAVAVDQSNGRVAFAGSQAQAHDFGGGTKAWQNFIAMYDKDGNYSASTSMIRAGTPVYTFNDLVFDIKMSQGVVAVTGIADGGKTSFDNGITTLDGAGMFIAKYNAALVNSWAARTKNVNQSQQSSGVAVSIIGDGIALGACIDGMADFGQSHIAGGPLGYTTPIIASYWE